MVSLTLLSWNVLAFAGHPSGPFVTRPEVVVQALDFISERDPDLVAFQEAPAAEGWQRGLGLRPAAPWPHGVAFRARWPGQGDYPHGFPGQLLSRFAPLEVVDLVATTDAHLAPAVFQRHWGRTLLALPEGKSVWLVQTHLCADYDGKNHALIRLEEVRLLLADLATLDAAVPVLLCGDFNFLPDSEPYRQLLAAGFQDTCPEPRAYPTVPVPNPVVKIDFIFYRGPGLTCTAFERPELRPDPNGRWLSDHFPIMATFSLR